MQLSTPGFAPLVRVTCNNSIEGTFLIATGINNCYITNRLADKLQLPRFKLSEKNETCILSSLRLGNVSFNGQMAFLVVNRQQLNTISQWMARDQSIDGILGATFFEKVPVLFDYPNLQLTVFPVNYKPTPLDLARLGMINASVLPLRLGDRAGHYVVPVVLGSDVQEQMLVDTGYRYTVISPTAAKALDLNSLRQIKSSEGATHSLNLSMLSSIKLGTITIPNVGVVYFSQLPPNADWWDRAVLGANVLGQLRILYDLPEGKLYLQLPSEHREQLGVEVLFLPDPLRMTITNILPGSPAAQVGLLSGDEILAIDGQEVSELTPDEAMRLLHPVAGKTLVLEVLHKGASQPTEIRISIPK
jgi:predicted aspartyl protease